MHETADDKKKMSLLRLPALALLAMSQLLWAGYQFGVGNQSIQVAFLQRLHDATLFARDAMVNETLAHYPSFFFRLLAPALSLLDTEPLYLLLHLLTTVGVLAAVYALARCSVKTQWGALVAILFLVGGHQQALAEQGLYSTGFTHTWAVLPLSISALALLYAGRPALAFLLAGAICNLHALEGGQLGLVMGFWALCNVHRLGWRRFMLLPVLFLIAASPAVLVMLRHHQEFDGQWLDLMRLRSGHNSFPLDAWQPGRTAMPRFAALLSLAALSLSLLPTGTHRRKSCLLVAGMLILFVAGTLFTEVWPHALAVRAQLLRPSRFMQVLLLVYIAAACVRGWKLPFRAGGDRPRWHAWLEFIAATVTAASLALPGLLPLLPFALALTLAVALVNGRLHWSQAAVAGLGIVVCLIAWHDLDFTLPGLTSPLTLGSVTAGRSAGWLGWGMLTGAVGLWWLAERRLSRTAALTATGVAILACGWGLSREIPRWLSDPGAEPAWTDVQRWARAATPVDALFLTPMRTSGFRMHSQRSIVGDWRDGTQLYFSSDYAETWWTRMNDLQPGMQPDPTWRRLLVRGRSLSELPDAELIELAETYQATHIVTDHRLRRRLRPVFTNAAWAVYLPEIMAVTTVSEEVAEREQRTFMQTVAIPNLARYRQGDVALQFLNEDGRPVYDAAYDIRHTGGACGFGVSFPWLEPPPGAVGNHDFVPPPVTAAQLETVAGLFNHTVLSYSAWWSSLEPEQGQRRFEELDRAVDWCTTNGISTELSFLSGFPPRWLRKLPPKEQRERLQKHALELVARYHGRIDYWRVTDQDLFSQHTALLIKALRKRYPDIVLGVGYASSWLSPRETLEGQSRLRRGVETIRRLKQAGAGVDYVALHALRPWGMRASGRQIYAVLDTYADEGVRLHLSDFAAPAEGWMESVANGAQWNMELQAEYAAAFYTAAYSHPAVDVINYGELGPVTRMPGAGLLDSEGRPRPILHRLRELMTEQWSTALKGTLPLDGRVQFRGVPGTYALTLKSVSGRAQTLELVVPPASTNTFTFRLDAAGTITREDASP